MTHLRIDGRSLEPAVQRIGQHIFQLAESAAPSVLSLEYWQQATMSWLTREASLKQRLFRFIEVLPALRDTRSVARHLREYLCDEERDASRLPELLRLAVAYERPDSLYATIVARLARFACATGAKQFIAGATPREALRTIRRLRAGGNTFTLDVLGEAITADHIARQHQAQYIELIRRLSAESGRWRTDPLIDAAPWGRVPKVNISIKLSALVVSFDPMDWDGTTEAVLDRLRPVLRAARDCGAFVNVDMEHYAVKRLTFDIFRRVLMEPEFRPWPDCGIVVQAYTPEGDGDFASLAGWARRRGVPISVRLVKGAYWDSETALARRNGLPSPLYAEKWQSDAAFERIGRDMLENADIIRPAFASHNVRSIAAALAMEEALGLPSRTLELQMLTGMGEPLRRAVTRLHQRVRVYSPFGDMITGMAYLIRRLIENTANESFLRQSFGGDIPVDDLLRNPAAQATSGTRHNQAGHASDPVETPRGVEPAVNFVDAAAREALGGAILAARAAFGAKHPPIIDNEPVQSDAWLQATNPSNPAECVGLYAECDEITVHDAVSAARRAAGDWAALTAEARAEFLDRIADAMRTARFELMAWMILETGKTWRDAANEYRDSVSALRACATEARRLRRGARSTTATSGGAMGPVAVIAPFCNPLVQIVRMTAASLAAGRPVVVKPARQGSICAAVLCRLMIDSGLPAGVLNLVTGHGATAGAALVAHEEIDAVAFAGSPRVAGDILASVRDSGRGAHKPVFTGTGRERCLIIDDDADLDDAVEATIAQAFAYAGQACHACRRAVVVGGAFKPFLDKLRDAAEAMQSGPAEAPATGLGPLIDARAVAAFETFIEMAGRSGRVILPGGALRSQDGGYFVRPFVIADVHLRGDLWRRPPMAPILAVARAASFSEAIEIADDFAVCGDSLFSRSPGHVRLARDLFLIRREDGEAEASLEASADIAEILAWLRTGMPAAGGSRSGKFAEARQA